MKSTSTSAGKTVGNIAAKKPAGAPSKTKPKKTLRRTPKLAPETFGEALKQAQKLFDLIDQGQLTDKRARKLVANFLINSDTVRGLCIVLLTGSYKASDNVPAVVYETMRGGPAAVFEVMAKNVVMAPTMAVTHRRNNDAVNAAASDLTTERSIKLIRLIDSPAMNEQLNAMKAAFLAEPDAAYLPFVKQWKYDQNPDQVQAALKALEAALPPKSA